MALCSTGVLLVVDFPPENAGPMRLLAGAAEAEAAIVCFTSHECQEEISDPGKPEKRGGAASERHGEVDDLGKTTCQHERHRVHAEAQA